MRGDIMPSLMRFMIYCLVLVGLFYGIIALIAFSYEPQSRLISSNVSLEKLNQ